MKKGFTLVELLAVMLLIGILSAVAIPQYTRSVRRAEITEGLTHGKTIYDAALRFKAVNGDWPRTFDQLSISFMEATAGSSAFDDGSFIYSLVPAANEEQAYVSARSTKGDYELRFIEPIVNSNGVFAPIACCPGTSNKGIWLCENVAKAPEAGETIPGLPNGCREVK